MKTLLWVALAGAAGILWWRISGGSAAPERRAATTESSARPPAHDTSGGKVAPPGAGSNGSPGLESTDDLRGGIVRALREGAAARRDRALYVELPRLVATDSAAAARLALEWRTEPLRDELLRQVVRTWLAKDPQGALAWVASLHDPADREVAGKAAVGALGKNDPASAIDLALALGIGTGDGSVEHTAQIWAEEDLAGAETWITAKPQGVERDRLLARIAGVQAQRDPAGAAAFVLAQTVPGPARDEALLGVVRHWAASDPAEAAKWVAQFPPGPFVDRAVALLGTFSK